MERLGDEGAGQRASIGRVALASRVGTAIEYYDFLIYGTAAALVFGQLFFPNEDPFIGTLAAFATYAVGFVARPVGAWSSGILAIGWAARRCWSSRSC
jgi:MFS transporter, MHS family, shikimate and dehydroshikimate transport protein